MDSTNTTPATVRTALSLTLEASDSLTWADLRRFVSIAGDIPDDSPLEFVYDDQYTDILLGIRVNI